MGQFSWLDCITEEQIVDDKHRDVYVLIPKEFGGGHIVEHCYDGYGHFGDEDIFDLVAYWNRDILSEKPNFIFPYAIHRAKYISENYKWDSDYSEKIDIQIYQKPWYKYYSDNTLTMSDVVEKCKKDFDKYFEWRYIGIALACYDEDNEALPFPIKITHNPNATYEHCRPSKSDPNQGWEVYDDYDDEEDEDDGWY